MASFSSERQQKIPLIREGFQIHMRTVLLNRKERNALFVKSTHLSSGQLNSVALTIDRDPLVLQVWLRNLAGSVQCV